MQIPEDDPLRKAYLHSQQEEIIKVNQQFKHDHSLINGHALGWWLRSPGSLTSRAMLINCHGAIKLYWREVSRNLVGVRPAMWI